MDACTHAVPCMHREGGCVTRSAIVLLCYRVIVPPAALPVAGSSSASEMPDCMCRTKEAPPLLRTPHISPGGNPDESGRWWENYGYGHGCGKSAMDACSRDSTEGHVIVRSSQRAASHTTTGKQHERIPSYHTPAEA